MGKSGVKRRGVDGEVAEAELWSPLFLFFLNIQYLLRFWAAQIRATFLPFICKSYIDIKKRNLSMHLYLEI